MMTFVLSPVKENISFSADHEEIEAVCTSTEPDKSQPFAIGFNGKYLLDREMKLAISRKVLSQGREMIKDSVPINNVEAACPHPSVPMFLRCSGTI